MKEKKQLLRILFLEENEPFITRVETILRETLPEFELKTAKTEKEFLKFVIRFQPNVILSGYQLNKYSAVEAFQLLRQEHHQIPFIIVTDKLSDRIVNNLVKKGMEDCLFKSDRSELPQAVLKAVEENKHNSEKEKAVSLLNVERSRLQTIFKNTPAAIMNISFRGDFLEINPSGLEMLQVEDEKKLDRKNIFDFIRPDDLNRYKKFHNTVGIGNKKTERFNMVGLKKEEVWIEATGAPLLDEEGHVASVLLINRDITDEQKAQKLINYHANLLENISDAVISFDSEIRIQSWNQHAERMYGWKAKEVIGRKCTELDWTKLTEEQLNLVIQKVTSNGHIEEELNYFHKNGKELTIQVSASALKDELGKMTGIVTVHRDITNRKQAEVALKENLVRFKIAEEITKTGNWELDFQSGKIVWSKQMFRIFEREKTEDMVSIEDFLSYVHPEDRDFIRDASYKLGEVQGKIKHRYRLLLKENKVKQIWAITQLLRDENGLPQKALGTVLDITELALAKEEALLNEKKFMELFENSPNGIYVEEENGFILDANKTACKFQGYSKQELIGKNFLDLVPGINKEEFSSRYKLLFNQEESRIESSIWDKESNQIPVDLKTKRIYYSGKPALLVYAHDISERKAEEKAKRESDRKFDALTEQAPVAIYHVDTEGKFIHFNKVFLDLFELTDNEVTSDEWKNRIHPEDLAMFMSLREETMGTTRKIEIHYRLLIHDKIKFVFGTSNPFFNDEGELIGRIGTILDMTENRLANEKIIGTQKLFQNLFDHSPDSIYIEDLKGNILNVNAKACLLQGLEYDELVGKNIRDLVPANKHDVLMRNHELFCNGTLHRLKVSIWNKEGKEVPVEIRANLIDYFETKALLLHVSTIES